MKRTVSSSLSSLMLTALLGLPPMFAQAQAQAQAQAGQGAAATAGQAGAPHSPDEREANGIRYLTGGVGVHEAESMRSSRDQFSLQLTFTGTGGKFLAGVETRLLRANGKPVFATVSDGPFLFIHMPPGQYRVVASYQGQSRETNVTVPARGSVARALIW